MGAVVGFIAGEIAGSYLTKTVGGFFAKEFLGVAFGKLAGSLIGAGVSGLLAEKPESPDFGDNSAASGMLINKSANDAPIPVIYGQRKIGGTRVLLEITGTDNEYLHMVLAMSEGEINSFENVYLNDVLSTDAKFSGFLDVYKHTGSTTQAADSNLVTSVSGWTSNHQLKGTAYLYIKMKYDQDVFASGLPTITADLKGAKVYDARTATTAWSDNPVLCIRDYLTNTRYGRGIETSLIDDTSFNAAANYCEESVTIGGVSKTRYTCNGVVDTSQGSMDVLKKLLTACRGFLIFSGGKYKLIIDKVETAAFTFSEDNIIGAWSIKLGDKNSQFNRMRANFFNPDRAWQPDIAVVDSSTLRTQDNGLLLEKTIDLPFTSDIDRAKMITTINLNQSRQQIMCEFTATIEGLRCEVGDVVYVKHATPGWDTLNSNAGKKFRVMRITLQNNDEVRILAMEYDATAYDFGTIAVSDAAPNTNLPDATTAQPPTAIAIAESLYSTIGGGGVKVRVDISWNAAKDIFVQEYDVEWKENGASTWNFLTTTKNLTARLDDANPVIHDFRVRSINSIGVRSIWATLSNVTIAGLTTPPVDVAGLSLVALSGSAHISWNVATDLDVLTGGKVRFRHSNLTTGASWESSTDIGAAVAGHNTNAVLPLLSGTYMAKFVDSTGNASVNASSFAITTVPDIIKMNAVTTSNQHPSFTGTKTNLVAVDNVLKFEADTLLDSVTDLMDDWELLDAIGGTDTAGTYAFDTYIDLGQTFTSRVTANLAFSAFVIGDLIDDRTALMDTWTDFDNAPSDVEVDLYVATTTDDPAGSPTWGSWAKFTVADYSARALKFKIEATSSSSDHQINITELSVTIDMPDRVQGSNGIQTGTSKLSITYPSAFKAVPSLGITITDAGSNDLLEITNETTTGFDVGVKHGASYTDHKINWLARGY